MKNLVCFLFLLLPLCLQAQVNVDSLVNVLETKELTTSQQLKILDDLCNEYTYIDIEQMFVCAKKGLALSQKENDDIMLSKFYEHLGFAYLSISSKDTALVYLEKALEYAVEAKDKNRETCVYTSFGHLYEDKQQYSLALEYYMKALSLNESTGDKKRHLVILSNIGGVHKILMNNERAIYFLEQAKAKMDEVNSPVLKMKVNYELGCVYYYTMQYEKALECFSNILEICKVFDNPYYESACLNGLATTYLDGFNEHDKALECAQKSLVIAEKLGVDASITFSWNILANVYREQKRYEECEAAAFKILEIDSTDLDIGRNALSNIVFANIHLGNKEKADRYLKEYLEAQILFSDKSLHDSLADMEVKYETEKKEMRIATLEEEQKLYTGLGITLVITLLMGIGLLFYRHRLAIHKRKIAEQQVKQLEQEKELIATRSALDAEKAEREILARDLHDGVGAMLSVVKNNMNSLKSYSIIENKETDYFNMALEGLDKSITELRRVAHHIMPAILIEKGLFAALDDFCRSIPEAEFHCTESGYRFNPEKELVLYRCAYELVNNALRHSGASHIDIHLSMDEETAYLSIVDNGCGFDTQTSSPGMGINNMRTRLAVFGGRIDIYSEEQKGTEVNIELDVKE